VLVAQSGPTQASPAGRTFRDPSLAQPSVESAYTKLHHHHLMEAGRTAVHPEEVHQLGREVGCRIAAVEEVHHIAAEVEEPRIAVAAVVDLDPVVRACVSFCSFLVTLRVQEDTHSILVVLLAGRAVVTDILVERAHMTVVLGTVLAVADQVCCTVTGRKTVEVLAAGRRHTAAMKVVGRMMVAVVRRNLVAVEEDMTQVVRTVLAAAAVLRFARIAGTSSLRLID